MAFRPLYDRVLIRRAASEEITAGGIIIPGNAQEKSSIGEVISVGQGTRAGGESFSPLHVKAGDTVMLNKWSGTEIIIADESLLVVAESDILGILD